jgi:transposase InsO family protein
LVPVEPPAGLSGAEAESASWYRRTVLSRRRRHRTAQAVEWLSDNGSAYRAKDTLEVATALGLRLAFTPPRSPEGNGLAEAFVKTLKRDYATVTLLPDAPTILRLVASWIEDYNTSHPHSGLRMLSPREFRTRCA